MSEAVTAPSGSKCGKCGAVLEVGVERCNACGMPVLESLTSPTTGSIASSAAPTQTDIAPGETLMGQWTLESKLGEGGMGNVFLATELKLGRKVAVKALSVSNLQEETVKRFEREAQVMGKLDHPNVVTLYAVGRHREIPFLVMRYLEGGSLWDLLDANGGRLLPEQLVPLVKQLCSALGYIHGKGLIHRDLKPSNIFISPTGKVTVLDLGLARGHNTTLTRTGIIWGTPDFMAPEQIVGEKQLDGRADLYALAVVLYRMISNQPPFPEQDEQALMRAHLTRPRPDICKVWFQAPPAIGLLLQKAMAIKPEERFQTADEFSSAFERAAASREQSTRASSPAALATVAPPPPSAPSAPAAPPSAPPTPDPTPPAPPPVAAPSVARAPTPAAPVPAVGDSPFEEDERTAIGFLDPAITGAKPPEPSNDKAPAPAASDDLDDEDGRTVALVESPVKAAATDELNDEDEHTVALTEAPLPVDPSMVQTGTVPSAGKLESDIAEGEDDRTAVGFLPPMGDTNSGQSISVTPVFEPVPLGSNRGASPATVMDRPAVRTPPVPMPAADPGSGTVDEDDAYDDLGDEPKTEIAPPSLRALALDGVSPKASAPKPRPSISTKQRREPAPPPPEETGETPAWLHPYVLVVGGLLLLALGFLIGVLLR